MPRPALRDNAFHALRPRLSLFFLRDGGGDQGLAMISGFAIRFAFMIVDVLGCTTEYAALFRVRSHARQKFLRCRKARARARAIVSRRNFSQKRLSAAGGDHCRGSGGGNHSLLSLRRCGSLIIAKSETLSGRR